MAKKTKTLGANLPVPQNRNDAASYISRIGESSREIDRIEADMNDKMSVIKEQYEAKAQPLREQVAADTEGLKLWAEANRDALTNNGKTKTADLGTGKISWRALPPKVTVRGMEKVISAIRQLRFREFLRTKIEIDKDAMLADPVKARKVPGITIGSEGEQFFVEPFEAEILREAGQ